MDKEQPAKRSSFGPFAASSAPTVARNSEPNILKASLKLPTFHGLHFSMGRMLREIFSICPALAG